MTVANQNSKYGKVVEDLADRFNKATRGIRVNGSGTQLHRWQVEFAYLLDDIARGPEYIAPKVIDTANDFIAQIIKMRGAETQQVK